VPICQLIKKGDENLLV